MERDISVVIADDAEHESVFAEIMCDGKFVAVISVDTERPLLELPGCVACEQALMRTIELDEFERGVRMALDRVGGRS